MAIDKYIAPDLGGEAPGYGRFNQAAGAFIFAASTGRCLLQQRGKDGDFAGFWGQFGGGVEAGETREAAVQREVEEETGYSGPIFMRALKPNVNADFTYHNFAAVVPQEFEPVVNEETMGHVWCEFGQWPTPLHPGIEKTFKDGLSMSILREVCSQRDYYVQQARRYGKSLLQDWNNSTLR